MVFMLNIQIDQKRSTPPNEKSFELSALKGNIGKAVVETYFTHFGYEIYPFGYENHYANVTRFIKRDPLKDTMAKIRAMPDLLVFDREKEESSLVEIKASNCKKELGYWIEEDRFDCYRKNWQDAVLVIYLISSGEVICKRISDIENWTKAPLTTSSKPGYYIDLSDFCELPVFFSNMDRTKYDKLNKKIKTILAAFKVPQRNINSCYPCVNGLN
jgi:hypothetical protein